jgi:hypothetical protein
MSVGEKSSYSASSPSTDGALGGARNNMAGAADEADEVEGIASLLIDAAARCRRCGLYPDKQQG